MRNESLFLVPRQAATLLLLCCACLFASAAARDVPCHEAAMADMAGAHAAASIAARGEPTSTDAASAAVQRGHDAHRRQHPASPRDFEQDLDSATGAGSRVTMHPADGTVPAGDCCDGGSCAMDCGCTAVALIAVPAPGAPPARTPVPAITAVRQPSLAPGELLRPPIPA